MHQERQETETKKRPRSFSAGERHVSPESQAEDRQRTEEVSGETKTDPLF